VVVQRVRDRGQAFFVCPRSRELGTSRVVPAVAVTARSIWFAVEYVPTHLWCDPLVPPVVHGLPPQRSVVSIESRTAHLPHRSSDLRPVCRRGPTTLCVQEAEAGAMRTDKFGEFLWAYVLGEASAR
jgi:hypothetical protein